MERRWLPVRQEGTWKVRCYTVGQTVEKIKFRVPDAIAQNREKTRREALARARGKRSQQEMADFLTERGLPCAQQTLSSWESGDVTPKLPALLALEKILRRKKETLFPAIFE